MKNLLEKSLGLSAVAVIVASLAYGGVHAAEKAKKKAEPTATTPAPTTTTAAPRCNSLTAENDCKAREDCTWIAASIDAKTQKQKRKAYCRSKPKKGGKKADKKT